MVLRLGRIEEEEEDDDEELANVFVTVKRPRLGRQLVVVAIVVAVFVTIPFVVTLGGRRCPLATLIHP